MNANTTTPAATTAMYDGQLVTIEADGPVNGLGEARVYVRPEGAGYRVLVNVSSLRAA